MNEKSKKKEKREHTKMKKPHLVKELLCHHRAFQNYQQERDKQRREAQKKGCNLETCQQVFLSAQKKEKSFASTVCGERIEEPTKIRRRHKRTINQNNQKHTRGQKKRQIKSRTTNHRRESVLVSQE